MMKRIGIIGYGNMGAAIVQRLQGDYAFFIFDKDKQKTRLLKGKNICAVEKITDLLDKPEAVILAVKPQDLTQILEEISKDSIQGKQKLFISIAAGISTEYLEKYLGEARIIRAMPNLPMKIGAGMICLSKGKYAAENDLEFASSLFKRLGDVLLIKEELMNAATAVSGSGPGFFFALVQGKPQAALLDFTEDVFLPELILAAEESGFASDQARVLARATAAGSLGLLVQSNLSAQELCGQVTSKGGTTQAGLEVLGGEVKNLKLAVRAAKKRAEELAKKE